MMLDCVTEPLRREDIRRSMSPPSSPPLSVGLQRIGLALLGILLALAGFVLVLGALAVGLVAAAGLVIWALLRGRKPTIIRFGGGAAPFARRPVRPTPRPRRAR